MVAARDAAGLQTTNMSWTMVEAVFQAFRRRLTVAQAIVFANALPPLLRALFLDGWQPEQAVLPFASREAITREVLSLRPQHNFSPPNAVGAVATALRQSLGDAVFARLLAQLPAEAAAFWADAA